MKKTVKRKEAVSVIAQAHTIVNDDRQDQYGDPVENAVADAIVAATMGVIISPSDVVRVMIAKKVRRTALNDNQDTRIDIVGYTEILDRTIAAEKSGETRKIAAQMLEHLL